MRRYSRSQLSDAALLQDFGSRLSLDQSHTAELLATMAEIDVRKLHLPAGYPSMYAYSVGHWHMSEDVAYKRIRAARAARRFPALFVALEEGRLHLAAVVMLAPHLTRENAAELIAAATHQTKARIELVLAERFPQPDLVTSIEPMPVPSSAPGCSKLVCETSAQLAPGPVQVPLASQAAPQLAPGRVESPARITPLAPQRFAIQFTVSGKTHEKLRRAQALMSHAIPSQDLAELFDRALDLLIAHAERERFAATEKPRPGRRSKSVRHVRARVRRAVWKRDQGRCTFVSDTGYRCESRARLEFDHVTPAARGGEATADNLRLRCRAHNQYEAERVFGESFMRGKRERARQGSIERRTE